MLREQGIITDEKVLEAICWHTTGHPDMDKLARIIYIADYIEPNRDFPGVDMLREITHRDLDRGVLAGLDHTISFLIQQGGLIHPNSVAARNRLVEKQTSQQAN
jgi:predicted HD superfamily hydrolase involved in NAD metabolism